jgi:hypothetical protein
MGGASMLMSGHPTLDAQGPGPCSPPLGNPIVCENQLAGNPASEWDIVGAGDSSIQGFATDISVNRGQTVSFKIDTNSTNYRLDIYRMGYYGGMGARKVATVNPSAALPQTQPNCLNDATTGLIDCGNWAISASWAVPSTAVSGIYFAKLVRTDNGGASHVVFVVRDDSGQSDVLFQTSDTTWQAYNQYGGNSLYVGSPAGRAFKVSYNRPFTTRGTTAEDWVFNAEYPMVRWLEANGFNVSYFTGVDSDRIGAEIREHKVFLSVGHDEYWSGGQRTNVEAARAAGVHLAFLSGNEIFWKTRWENSLSSPATPYRTLVTYKETHANNKIDPTAAWTGTWRDPRFSPPADGGRPENALSGTIFTVNCCTYAITVPSADGKMRFWRNTTVANLPAGQTATLPNGTLGYEWDEDLDNGFRPAGLIRMSDTTVTGVDHLLDYGSTYASGTANHALTLYRHSSGALVFGAGTVQWSWGLDSNHDRGSAPPSTPMQQATVNLLADMGVQPLTLQAGLTTATPSSDTAAPTSTITSPANGSPVPANTFITISGTAADVGGGVVGGVEVSADGGATWRRATGRGNWTFSWHTGPARTATLFARAVDDSGNLETPVSGISLVVGGVTSSCPCSLWIPSQGPTDPVDNDGSPVELGTRFRSDVNGFITAIRFYKHLLNTGTHVGHLWTAGGTQLSSVTFTGESPSGWQEATLPSPVQITANTLYVVSYSNAGVYSGTNGYFGLDGVDSGPLHAPQDGTEGGNGVFRYGANVFPNQTFESENYWVDVVFVTSIAPDTTPPLVNAVAPPNGSSGAAPNVAVTATFNENVTSVSTATFDLTGPGSSLVSAAVSYNAGSRTATLTPDAPLAYSTTYTARLRGGSTGIKDVAGNPLAADYVWSFTTSGPPPPPPNEGPGGPVLVVGSSADPFSRYYAEVLRAEGINSFTATDISLVTANSLLAYDAVILGAIPLTTAQVTMFSDWVTAGGNLIAMRPDKKLAALLGIADAAATLSEGYLLVNNGSAPGAGIVDQTMQFHGVADRYSLNGATAVATLYTNATTSTTNPAVTLRSVGTQGGQAAAFAFDLARSIVLTRQGNPAWSGQERDGVSPVRSDDLFFGGAQTDWVNLNKVAIPQADEQQRLLANLILHMNSDKRPLPRFWYFPRGEKAVVVMTGDDHANNGTAGRFDIYKANSPANCSVVDWECIRATSYIYPNTPITNAQAAAYVADGFEIAVHISTGCANYTPSSLQASYVNDLAQFASLFPGVPPATTNRTHCIAWSDFDTQPQVAVANGIRLDTNYYYYPSTWVQDRPGFMTGSGMPMRFAKADGTLIDVYQAATQMTDESGQTWPFTVDTLLDRAIGPEGYYGVFTTNMHTDFVAHVGSESIVASAIARSVPVISAKQLLTWLDGRNGSTFSNITWNGSALGFTVAVGAGANGLEGMLPASVGTKTLLGVTRSGVPVPYRVETIKGIAYAIFSAAAGAHQADYGTDTTPPIITGPTATPSTGSATIVWNTNEASDSRVDYGLAPNALTLSVSNSSLTSSHSVFLSGLNSSTTYYYRVRSADASGNPAFSPVAPATANFTTLTPPSLNCPCTIWPPTQVPTVITEPDGSAVELGVKFRASFDGFITGIRFYKGPQNTGVHVGHLWTSTGALLSSVTFSDESASGWQTGLFAPPVAVTANTVYVASYHAPNGFYPVDVGYFSTAHVSGPLEALANGTAGGNGVYRYGPSGFPTDTSNSTNYWVDVIFETTPAPDSTAPTIVATVPTSNATGVDVSGPVRARFSEAMNSGSINPSTVVLRDITSNVVAASVTYDQVAREARLQPSLPLLYSSTYTVTVVSGPSGARDVAGNSLAADYAWSFTTRDPPPPPPDEGPGGPILIISSLTNPFTKYYAEVLRAEGLNAFLVSDITAVTASTLAPYKVVLLGEMPLSSAQTTMFTDWVTSGGKLIAMRPDKQLAGLLGITDVAATLTDAYLKIDTSTVAGTGIVGETIQFHGPGDLYVLDGATPIATFFSDSATPTSSPAVTVRSIGSAGGKAVAFTYDLARSIVYTRQGNPAWSGQDRDGLTPIRSNDLFFGGTQPNYVDLSKVAIPQADEQQRLLANLIVDLTRQEVPLPRFWYFPRGLKAVVVMTGDDHGHNGTAGQFDFFNSRSSAGCVVANWECVRGTSYIYPDTPITPAAAAAYVAQGFEIAAHITTNCANYTSSSLDGIFVSELAAFANVFGNLPTPKTNRTHCIAWSDYTTQAEVSNTHGIRLDTNYYYWPPGWVNDVPGLFTGSGMPMRFAKTDGSLIDVYQATTQMTDESNQTYPFTVDRLLDRALGAEGYYGAFVANMHTDFPIHNDGQAIVIAAQARGVPVISAKQLLDWLDGRNAASYSGLSWTGNTLTFSVSAGAQASGLEMLIPAASGNRFVTGVTRDGQAIGFTLKTVKGVNYAVFDASAGQYAVQFTVDDAPPTISSVVVAADAFEATVTWTTNEVATSRIDYATNPNQLSSHGANGALTTAHSVRISGLTAGTTYYYRVASGDFVGNVASSPASPAPPLSFKTLSSPQLGCPCSIWTQAQAPALPSSTDTGSVELGVKFRPSIDGYITGVRFFKGPLNTGQHVGNLWTDTGTLLTSVIFSNETPSGWQQASFAAPVAVSANTTYVISYHTNVGGYAADQFYFQDTGVTNGPLTALAEGISGSNGVFRYGSTSAFPFESFRSTNYWVDLVFLASLPPPPPPGTSVTDTSAADFAAGSVGAGLYVAGFGNGEVALSPSIVEELDGTALPAGWSSSPWATGGTSTVNGGQVTVNGARFAPDTISVGPRTTLEFAATFTTEAFQHGGFALTFNENRWAMFSTSTGTGIFARTHDGVSAIDTLIPGNWLGSSHSYRIDWSANSVAFFVDGIQVASHAQAIAGQMRPAFSDVTFNGTGLIVDSLRLAPYATTGTFVSRALDAGSSINWNSSTSSVLTPPGTSLSLSVRFGNTSVPDGTWSSFTNVSSGTASLAATSRYAQYRAILAGDGFATPVLESITLSGTNVPPPPTISISDITAAEGTSNTTYASFVLTLSSAASSQVSVAYSTTAGSATANTDYLTTSGTAVFPQGSTSVAVLIPIVGDSAIEPAETFVLGLSGPINATLAATQATATIIDDDLPSFVVSDSHVVEGDTGTIDAVFTISLTQTSSQAVSVNYATANGTAVAPQDFSAVSGTATFAPGTTSQQVRVPVAGDTVDEGDETLSLTLNTPVNAPILDGTGVGTITDNDPTPSLTINDVSVTEGDTGAVSATFVVTLSAVSGRVVTVNYATADGGAVAPQDYAAITGALTFSPGETSKLIAVSVSGDLADEPNETFQVNLSAPANATIPDAQGIGTIVDNDLPGVSIADVTVTEGNTGTLNALFNVSISSPSAQPISVNYATSNGTAVAPADYSTRSGTLTIPAGSTSAQITVPVVGDTLDEQNETFVVTLTAPVNAAIADDSAIGTITDNDGTPSLAINNVSVTETDAGSVNATFTVNLSSASGQTVSVNYSTANVTATSPADYGALSGTLAFAPGMTTQQISVLVNGDTLEEANETFQVNLASPVNATLADGLGVGTIVDNDPPTISINNRTVTEGNTGTLAVVYTVSLSFAHSQPVSLNYATANGTAVAPADYTAVSGTLTIPAGATSGQITVQLVGDVLDEANETYTVNLSSPVNGTIANGTGLGTITDNDATPSFSVNDVSVTETNTGTINATFTVTLSAASGQTVTVNRSTVNGTATAPADYTALASSTLTFPPGTTTQTVIVTVASDVLDEANETFQVRLATAVNATIADNTGVGTIVDNDPAPTAVINDVTITEANTGTRAMTFTVTLSAPSGQVITIPWATANGTATAPSDYTAASGTLNFTAGSTTRTIVVTTIGDTTVEPTETLLVNLSIGTNVTINDAQGIGTILNND